SMSESFAVVVTGTHTVCTKENRSSLNEKKPHKKTRGKAGLFFTGRPNSESEHPPNRRVECEAHMSKRLDTLSSFDYGDEEQEVVTNESGATKDELVDGAGVAPTSSLPIHPDDAFRMLGDVIALLQPPVPPDDNSLSAVSALKRHFSEPPTEMYNPEEPMMTNTPHDDDDSYGPSRPQSQKPDCRRG